MTTDKIQGSITRFFSNPLVGMIGTAASVLGVGLAVFFYFLDAKTPDLTALVYPIRTTVVKLGQASNLSVKFQDKVIDSDIASAQIAIWNRGRLSIRPSSVLKPVEIVMPGARILEATIRKQSRDVANLRLNTSNLDQGRVLLSWDILERGDGGIIQLIYAGDNTAQINFQGVIEGQPSISCVEYPTTSNAKQPYKAHSDFCDIVTFIIACSLSPLVIITYPIINMRVKRRAFRIIIYTLIAAAVVYAIYGLLLARTFFDLGPPFGF